MTDLCTPAVADMNENAKTHPNSEIVYLSSQMPSPIMKQKIAADNNPLDEGNEGAQDKFTDPCLSESTAEKNEGTTGAVATGISDRDIPSKGRTVEQQQLRSQLEADAASIGISISQMQGGNAASSFPTTGRVSANPDSMETPRQPSHDAYPYQSPNAHSSQRGPRYPAFGKPNIHGHSYYPPPGPPEPEHQQWQHYNPRDPPYYPGHGHNGPPPPHMQGPTYHPPPPPHYHGYDNGPPPPPQMGSPHRMHRSPHPPPRHGSYNPHFGPPSGYYENYNRGYYGDMNPPTQLGARGVEIGSPRDARMPLVGQRRSHDETVAAQRTPLKEEANDKREEEVRQWHVKAQLAQASDVQGEMLDVGDRAASTGENLQEENGTLSTPERDSKKQRVEVNVNTENVVSVSPFIKARNLDITQQKIQNDEDAAKISMPPPVGISPLKEAQIQSFTGDVSSHVQGVPSSMPPPPLINAQRSCHQGTPSSMPPPLNSNSSPMNAQGTSYPHDPSYQGYAGAYPASGEATRPLTSPGEYESYYGNPPEGPYYGHYQYGPGGHHHPPPYSGHGAPHGYPPHQEYYYGGPNETEMHAHGPDYDRSAYYNNHNTGPPPPPQTPYAPPHSIETSQRPYVTPESHPLASASPSAVERKTHNEQTSKQSKAEEGEYTRLLRSKGERVTDRKKLQNKAWFDRFEELKVYKEEYGDCLVPQKFPINPR